MKNAEVYFKALLILPLRIKQILMAAAQRLVREQVYEIRLYAGGGIVLNTDNGLMFADCFGKINRSAVDGGVTPDELLETVNRASGYSLFARQREINDGYISFGEGYRLGICRTGKTLNSESISSVCLRLPQNEVFQINEICSLAAAAAKNGLLVAGAPGSGKTTILKKICVSLCRGDNSVPSRVCVADERGEFAVLKTGGLCIDIIGGCSKQEGIMRGVRLMSPEYIVCDEIGTPEEAESIIGGINSGVIFICAMHGGSINELCRKQQFIRLFEAGMFCSVMLLSKNRPGQVEHIYSFGEIKNEICRRGNFVFGSNADGAYVG